MEVFDESDLVFWSRQLSEHVLFLHLGLEVEPYKKFGKDLHDAWENFRNTVIPGNGSDMEKVSLFNRLVESTKEYKMVILKNLTSCQPNTDQSPVWMGWIYPSFVEHIIKELNYAYMKVNGIEVNPRDELNFWRIINRDHALFSAHLLDINQGDLIDTARALAKYIEDDHTCESKLFVRISLGSIGELDKFHREGKSLLDKNQVRSIIHPVLLTHVIREGLRSMMMIGKITGNQDVCIERNDNAFNDFGTIECQK